MKRLIFIPCTLLMIFGCALHSGVFAQPQTPFSQDSAAAYLRTLSVEIGPRPMGSPNERRAMEFALTKFREFGLTEAYILPMMSTPSSIFQPGANPVDGVNTNSGTAVGVLKGKSDRIIVIGGHIDSASPDIAGANDNGSGSATVIELARVLSQRENESTIVFALFGGEEQGLRGSRHFVSNFVHIDRVVLMLQIDMANGSDWILPLIHAGKKNTPKWLVRATYEEFKKLGYTGLSYPTHFFTLTTTVPGGGIGSDHIPFLERDIPAIDLTSDINDPIHTPQDTYENFKLSGLSRSGDLIYRLVERYDNGVPEEKTSSYYLFQLGSFLFFIPLPLLWLFVTLSVGLSIFILLRMRKTGQAPIRQRRTGQAEERRTIIPGLKLFFLVVIIQTFVWLSDDVMSLIKGVKFPWYQDTSGYFILAFSAALLGIWIALKITPSAFGGSGSTDPYRYFLRTVIFFLIFIFLALVASVKLAFYPAFALFFVSLAMLLRHSWLKIIALVISPHLMYRLCFSEGFDLIARSATQAPGGFLMDVLSQIIIIVIFSIISFPFMTGFAAARFSLRSDFFPFVRLRRWYVGVTLAGIFILVAIVLYISPSYTEQWRQQIHTNYNWDQENTLSSVEVMSPDYLKGAIITLAQRDTTIFSKTHRVELGMIESPSEDWISTERVLDIHGDTITILLHLKLKYRPYTLEVSYKSKNKTLHDGITSYAYTESQGEMRMRWYSFPDTNLIIPIIFSISPTDTVWETIRATFMQPITPVRIEKEFSTPLTGSTIISRTNVSKTTFLSEVEKSQ